MSDDRRAYDPATDGRITAVYLFANGMVAVFDQDGHQIPALQGREEVVRPLIEPYFPEVLWKNGAWR